MSQDVITESLGPEKKSKAELEQIVKANGGKIFQTNRAAPDTLCIADRREPSSLNLVTSAEADRAQEPSRSRLCKRPDKITSSALGGCLTASSRTRSTEGSRPFVFLWNRGMFSSTANLRTRAHELTLNRHMFHAKDEDQEALVAANVGKYNDSYARDTTVDELRSILDKMDEDEPVPDSGSLDQLAEFTADHSDNLTSSPGWLFRGLTLYFHPLPPQDGSNEGETILSDSEAHRLRLARYLVLFASAQVAETLDTSIGQRKGKRAAAEKPSRITHIIVPTSVSKADLSSLRGTIGQSSGPIPHVVTVEWVEESWKEGTLLDEESEFCPRPI